MKKHRYRFFLVILFLFTGSFLPGGDSGIFFLKDGTIRYCTFDKSYRVTTAGPVLEMINENESAYYLRTGKAGGESEYFAGVISDRTRVEARLHVTDKLFEPDRIQLDEGILFVMMRESGSLAGTLFRVDFNERRVSTTGNLLDYAVINGKLLTLDDSSPPRLSYSGINIPLAVSNPRRIMPDADGRIVAVKGGIEAELVDIKTLETVYSYNFRGELASPDELKFNMLLNLEDAEAGEMVFYNVAVNGIGIGRTETGPGEIPIRFTSKVKAGSYNRIELERWYLNRARGKYERENNIRQPKPLKIFFPEDAIIYIQVIFSEGRYRIETSFLLN